MARKRMPKTNASTDEVRREWLARLGESVPIAGIPGPGHWLVVEYHPTALFSLKISLATSSVGKTLVLPTPYSIKMAFVDAAFRLEFSDADCADFLRSLTTVSVRIAPPEAAAVTHTFVKVRQESRDADPLRPYIANIAYREVVHHHGLWRWAFDLAAGDDTLVERLVRIAPHVAYIGKRGSFVQFVGLSRLEDLGPQFTQPVQNEEPWTPPTRVHIVALDDFGPEANLETLSSFTMKSPKRDRHRRFMETVIPLGLVNTGPGFSEYRAE
ncbi:MAG: hypothetical protein ACREJ4_05880 [Candidatus Methylomirabilaceae bacterium]